jgi:hypothetical protein
MTQDDAPDGGRDTLASSASPSEVTTVSDASAIMAP